MSFQYVLLALVMGAVTYPSRAIPLLAPGLERLPQPALAYLRRVGPAVLAALAAAGVAVGRDHGTSLHLGVEWPAVALCVALVAWRRNLLLGLAAAAALVALARATGLG